MASNVRMPKTVPPDTSTTSIEAGSAGGAVVGGLVVGGSVVVGVVVGGAVVGGAVGTCRGTLGDVGGAVSTVDSGVVTVPELSVVEAEQAEPMMRAARTKVAGMSGVVFIHVQRDWGHKPCNFSLAAAQPASADTQPDQGAMVGSVTRPMNRTVPAPRSLIT